MVKLPLERGGAMRATGLVLLSEVRLQRCSPDPVAPPITRNHSQQVQMGYWLDGCIQVALQHAPIYTGVKLWQADRLKALTKDP